MISFRRYRASNPLVCLEDRPGGVMPDRIIQAMASKGMIRPFEEGVDRPGRISYGLTHYGYDVRLASEFISFAEWNASKRIDPKTLEPLEDGEAVVPTDLGVDHDDETGLHTRYLCLPPHSMALGYTVEYLDIPEDVVATVEGKFTYAKCGLIVSCPPLEPGWSGQPLLCLVNPTVSTIKVYADEGIAQVQFHIGYDACQTSYNDKRGNTEES
jgi:dCTP deaminase